MAGCAGSRWEEIKGRFEMAMTFSWRSSCRSHDDIHVFQFESLYWCATNSARHLFSALLFSSSIEFYSYKSWQFQRSIHHAEFINHPISIHDFPTNVVCSLNKQPRTWANIILNQITTTSIDCKANLPIPKLIELIGSYTSKSSG